MLIKCNCYKDIGKKFSVLKAIWTFTVQENC